MFVGAKRYSVEDLKLGMFVCELDRPWTDTPFIYQGFFLDTQEQIEEIRKHCEHVFVDEMRERELLTGIWTSTDSLAKADSRKKKPISTKSRTEESPREPYPNKLSVEEELEAAQTSRESANGAFQEIIINLRLGKKPSLVKVKEAVGGMVESVLRNPNAMVWLTRLKNADSYTYAHSLDVSAFLLVFGRHLGLPRDKLMTLGMGGLFLDIGKSRIALPLLQKRGQLTDTEYLQLRAHVKHGLDILGEMEGIPPQVLEMVAQHHERMDGSGYPNGLEGSRIEVNARMAAIVDTFDAVTSERPYAGALSSHEALRKLYGWAGKLFHKGLVEQFIECLGIYPVGTLVELNTGEVAIVLAQNRFRQLRPRLVLVLSPDKEPYGTMDVLDLIEDPVDKDQQPIEIVRALEPGMYGIDPREFYL